MKQVNFRIAVLLLLCVFQSVADAGHISKSDDATGNIQHFAKLTDNYYRGSQPDIAGLTFLAHKGVHTIVDLRGEDKDRSDRERETAQSLGMRYINLPLSTLHAPSDQQVADFLRIVHDPANAPIYVHCRRGSDRTGMMTAIVRIEDFGWTADKAYDEMKEYGFRPLLLPGMKRYVYKYADRKTHH